MAINCIQIPKVGIWGTIVGLKNRLKGIRVVLEKQLRECFGGKNYKGHILESD